MKVTVVNLNPCIDWQLTTPQFVYGGLNRVTPGKRYAAGKGINVCAALKNLGHDPLCVGFNYQENGAVITQALDDWGVRHDFIMVDGAVRVNIKLYDTTANIMTELNQPGAFVPEADISELCKRIQAIGDGILVLSGSMPAGVPANIYAKLCEAWPGVVVVDAEKDALKLALTSNKPPFCIKPNLFELESSFGVKLSAKEEIAVFCRELIQDYGVCIICVSMGADGAMLVTGDEAYYAPVLKLTALGVQGAGDAMVAGLVYGLKKEESALDLLRMASAAAAASVIQEGTTMCTYEDFLRFLDLIVVERM